MSLSQKLLPPLVSGTLFGAGLALSGMTDPARVRGFLDVFGAWDPTLVFVMGGAVLVMAVAWRIRNRMGTPIFAERFSLPDRKDLDGRLITGSIRDRLGHRRPLSRPGGRFAGPFAAQRAAVRTCDARGHGCPAIYQRFAAASPRGAGVKCHGAHETDITPEHVAPD